MSSRRVRQYPTPCIPPFNMVVQSKLVGKITGVIKGYTKLRVVVRQARQEKIKRAALVERLMTAMSFGETELMERVANSLYKSADSCPEKRKNIA